MKKVLEKILWSGLFIVSFVLWIVSIYLMMQE